MDAMQVYIYSPNYGIYSTTNVQFKFCVVLYFKISCILVDKCQSFKPISEMWSFCFWSVKLI